MLTIVVLSLLISFKLGLIQLSDIKNNKDLIDSVSTIVGVSVLLAGSLLSYFRFFKGRVLRPKVDLEIRSECFSSSDDKNLYWIEIVISNKGDVAIFNYRVFVDVHSHPSNTRIDMSQKIIQPCRRHGKSVVNIGEMASQHAVFELEKSAKAYTFEVSVIDASNAMWRRCLTLKNSPS
ncbi:MAG: hypothetical protein AAFX95_28140 [Cyanobacteria bacterium J06639_16]